MSERKKLWANPDGHPVMIEHTADWKQAPYNDEAVAELNAKMLFMAEHGSVCYGRA